MRKLIAIASLATVAAIIAVPAFAGNRGGGNSSATITFASSGQAAVQSPTLGSSVSFAVTANVKSSDVSKLWVTNSCSQNGVTVYAASNGVSNGTAGPFTLSWPGSGAATCTASVWLFPNAGTSLGSMSYSVSG